MHKGPIQTQEFLNEFLPLLKPDEEQNFIIFAPTINLMSLREGLRGRGLFWGAQNCFYENSGAFTGETSPQVLADIGATHCLVGHSERRQLFGETDEDVARKAVALLKVGVTPMVCVGETLEQRQRGETEAVVLSQVKKALSLITDELIVGQSCFYIAYEPVWAIGTGQVARPEDANAVHKLIRDFVNTQCSFMKDKELRIFYGGSVKPQNAKELSRQPEIDGFLIGGASLDPQSFYSCFF